MEYPNVISLVINIIAVIAAPIIAVWVGQKLQNHAQNRKEKMAVFKAVMTFRYGWSYEGVHALNSIHVVFSKDEEVRKRWREYYKMLCIQKPDDMQLEQRKTALYKLLESMSNSLGYKDEISWDDIQSPYIPKAMYDSINNTAIVQQGIANIVQQMNTNIQLPQTQPNEETTHPKAETSLKESAT